MPAERIVRRYTGFFRGWATAFGSHERGGEEALDLHWLFGEGQVGLVLTPPVKRFLYPKFLGPTGGRDKNPDLEFTRDALSIDGALMPVAKEHQRALDMAMGLLSGGGDVHLFQTYHLFYESGTRILTLSCHAPLPLVYRELPPLTVRLP